MEWDEARATTERACPTSAYSGARFGMAFTVASGAHSGWRILKCETLIDCAGAQRLVQTGQMGCRCYYVTRIGDPTRMPPVCHRGTWLSHLASTKALLAEFPP